MFSTTAFTSVMQPDGKLLAAGFLTQNPTVRRRADSAMARWIHLDFADN